MMLLGHTTIYLDRVCAGGLLHVRMGQAASSQGLCWPDITCKLFRDANHRLNPRDRDAKQLAISQTIGDRSLIDAAVALQRQTCKPVLEQFGQAHCYHRRVFLAPPWPELYFTDRERRHTPEVAVAEYYRLFNAYPLLGYEIFILPRAGVVERADFVLRTLEE